VPPFESPQTLSEEGEEIDLFQTFLSPSREPVRNALPYFRKGEAHVKKQQPRKLQLSKETLIRLEDLHKIVGGQRGDTDECEVTDYCNSRYQCYT
jgi:hypothetical protein